MLFSSTEMRDIVMVDDQELLKDLVNAISAWIEGGRGRSLSALARRCSIAYSTIRRIAQHESTPHPYTALAICEIVMATEQRVVFLKKHFPIIGNLMEDCYSKNIRPEPNEEQLSKFLSQEPHNRIFNIAATSAGASRLAIRRLAGDIGIEALDEMVAAGILYEVDNDTVKYSHENWALGNVEDTLRQIRLGTQHFDKSLIGTDGASLMHATGAISAEAVPELKKLILKFITDVNSLKNRPQTEGGVHFFCNLMYSLYDKEEWSR